MRQRPTASLVRRTVSLSMIVAVGVLLAGCSAPPWLGVRPPSAQPTSTAPATAEGVQNDLAAGAATRTIEVGAVTLTIEYWSTLSMDQWTADANKPLSISVHTVVTPADGQKVYLSRLTATPVVSDAAGTLPGFDPMVDQATIAPGYLVLDPYSYSQTFTLPAVDPAATSIALDLRYELLQQSTPESNDFAKQTAVDALTIAIAPE